MNDKILCRKLCEAFEHATPDVLPSVLSDCKEQKGAVIVMKKKKNSVFFRVGAIAAALALVIGLGIGFNAYYNNATIQTTISLDVNPSIEISVNRKDKVIEVRPGNGDGENILNNMDLEGSHIDVAVNAVLGSMLRHGYLSDSANSILISVDSKDASAGMVLQKTLSEQIGNYLGDNHIPVAVITQTMGHTDSLKTLAEQYGISEGKAQLIQRILEAAPEHTFAELAALSINELKLLSESSKIQIENITASGDASQKQYIGGEAALDAALTAAGADRAAVRDIEVDMDYEKGKMVYEVEFDLGAAEYEYHIDALTGEILYTDIDRDDDDDYDDDDDDHTVIAPETTITATQAKETAFAHAGVDASQVRDLEVELDEDDGHLVYEVEFDCNGVEYDYEIHAVTGEILSADREQDDDDYDDDDDDDDDDHTVSTPEATITAVQAKETAFAHAGVDASQVRDLEVELDEDDGLLVYEVEFTADGYEYEYKIHGVSGSILESDKEYDD